MRRGRGPTRGRTGTGTTGGGRTTARPLIPRVEVIDPPTPADPQPPVPIDPVYPPISHLQSRSLSGSIVAGPPPPASQNPEASSISPDLQTDLTQKTASTASTDSNSKPPPRSPTVPPSILKPSSNESAVGPSMSELPPSSPAVHSSISERPPSSPAVRPSIPERPPSSPAVQPSIREPPPSSPAVQPSISKPPPKASAAPPPPKASAAPPPPKSSSDFRKPVLIVPDPAWPHDPDDLKSFKVPEEYEVDPVDVNSVRIEASLASLTTAEFERFLFEGDSSLQSLAFFVHFGRYFTTWRGLITCRSMGSSPCLIPEDVPHPQRYLVDINACLEALKAISSSTTGNRKEIDFTAKMEPRDIMRTFLLSSLNLGSTFRPEVDEIVKEPKFDFKQSVQKFVTENHRCPLELLFEFKIPQKRDQSFLTDIKFGQKEFKVWYHLVFGINADSQNPIAVFVRRNENVDYFVWKGGSHPVERNPRQIDYPFQFCFYELIEIR